ncbi:MAG: Hcp family type VI secretion system effector [Planctomycetota bacterium]|jgi:type VI secretion system Hcp family effector
MPADAFLQINGIPGESTDEKHKDWIEILSYSHSVSQSGAGSRSTGGAATSGKCSHGNFSITKALDKASPTLNLFCSNGTHIDKITLELCRATGDKQPYMTYKLVDSVVSSVGIGGGGGGIPTETVTFNYGSIYWTYVETDHQTGKKKGEIKKFWNLVHNKGG